MNRKGYQLNLNIVRAQDLPIMGFYSCDAFLSAKVAGYLQTTPVIEGTQKPKFSTRIMFPVYFPLMNDKIILKLWDKRKLMQDVFIGNVPENPFIDNWFNINFL
jgi:Ca2+-dependent lipid-binding protein